jgi:hypothetical protein
VPEAEVDVQALSKPEVAVRVGGEVPEELKEPEVVPGSLRDDTPEPGGCEIEVEGKIDRRIARRIAPRGPGRVRDGVG